MTYEDRSTRELLEWVRRRCGNCDNWMKMSYCPKEKRNHQGRRDGPSMNGYACSAYIEDSHTVKIQTILTHRRLTQT